MLSGTPSGAINLQRFAIHAALMCFCCISWNASASLNAFDGKLDPVKVQLKWAHQFQFAGFYAAIEKGFYREAGLDVALIEARPEMNTDDEVLSGAADFGVGTSSILLLRAQGKPVVVLAVIFQHSPSVLLALRSSGIDTIHDLAGKQVMIEPNAASNLGYLRQEGLLDKVHIVRHSFNLDGLISGKIAAQSSFSTNEPYILQQAGIPYREFSPREGGVDFYGDNLFTTERQIAEHPERVKAFRQATLRGWTYAMTHVDEMIDLIRTKYAPEKSRGALRFEAQEQGKLMELDLIEAGYMNPGRWRHVAEVYAGLGMLPKGFRQHGLLYDPNPHADYTWLIRALAITIAIIATTLALIFYITRLNGKLRAQMAETQRMKDVAERANTEKQQFIAVASHDLRQPLYALSLFLDGLLACPLPERESKIVGNIRQSVRMMNELFDGLMDISRLETHVYQTKPVDFPIEELIARLHREFLPLALGKGLKFEFVTSSVVVHSDPLLLERILRNFLTNAVKYCEGGRILLGCRRRPASLSIEVHDTGPGIAYAHQKEIFQEYWRLSEQSDARGKSMGLGLAIVERLARILGHRLEVRSIPGKGSTFSVEVPLGEKVPAQQCAEDNRFAPMDMSVIVIEDEMAIRNGLRTMLTDWGCAVWTAASWEDCQSRLNEVTKTPDVIISDFQLGPGENGLMAIRRLRAIFDTPIPAILITGDVTRSFEKEAGLLSVPVLLKPVPILELHNMLLHMSGRDKASV